MRRESKVAAVSGAVILLLLATGPAQSLTGTDTVLSDDIKDGEVKAVDINTGAVQAAEIAANAVNGARVLDNSLTGADINEGTLAFGCRKGMVKGFATVRGYMAPFELTSSTDYIYNSWSCSGVAPQVRSINNGYWQVSFPGTNAQMSQLTSSEYYYPQDVAEYGRPAPGVFGVITSGDNGTQSSSGFNIVVY